MKKSKLASLIPDEMSRHIIGAHFVNIVLRENGEWVEYEGDWLKEVMHLANRESRTLWKDGDE